MTINKDTKASTIGTYIDGLETGIINLDAVISSYTTAVTTFGTFINPAFAITSWNDEVYTKLIGRATAFRDTEVAAIDTSIVSGNLFVLKNKISSLINALTSLKSYRSSYESLMGQVDYVNSTDRAEKILINHNVDPTSYDLMGAYTWGIVDKAKDLLRADASPYLTKASDLITNTINPLLTAISEITFTSTSSEENPAIGGFGDDAVTEDPADDETTAEDAPTGPFGTMQNPNGGAELITTSFTLTDYEGKEYIVDAVIDPTTGNIAYGNSEDGYIVSCRSEDGSVYIGSALDSYGDSLEGAAYLITDGHENRAGNGWGLFDEATYGTGGSIDPLTGTPSSTVTINCNGTDVTVYIPTYDQLYHDANLADVLTSNFN